MIYATQYHQSLHHRLLPFNIQKLFDGDLLALTEDLPFLSALDYLMALLVVGNLLTFQMLLQHLGIVLVQHTSTEVLFQFVLFLKVTSYNYVLFYVVVFVIYFFVLVPFLFRRLYPFYRFEQRLQYFLTAKSNGSVLGNVTQMDKATVEVLVAELYFIPYFGYLFTANASNVRLENTVDLHFQIERSSP